MRLIMKFLRNECATAIEYGLIAAGISLAIIAVTIDACAMTTV